MADPAPWQPISEPPPVTGEDGKMLPWVWQNTVHANGGATRAGSPPAAAPSIGVGIGD